MPFCTHCGTQVQSTAAFCQSCGTAQPGADTPAGTDPLASLKPRNAAILCYLPWLGWIMSLVILSTRRFQSNRLVRFHAFQGLYLAVVWLLIDMAIGALFGFAGIAARRAVIGSLKLSVICGWSYMLFKTSQGEAIRLPFLGDLADRSVAEHSAPRP